MNLVTVVEDLLTTTPRSGSTHVIAIDGRAGAGKTTLATELSLALSLHRKVAVIHLDEIYAGWELALSDSLTESLLHILKSICAGESITFPMYDWTWQQFDSAREISPCDVIIIEGVGSAQRVVRDFATASIWIDIDQPTGLERVLDRDGIEIQEEMNLWQRREEEHFLSDATRENADFILSTT
jgi:uridine kinase